MGMSYIPISLFILRPNKLQNFQVYIKRGKNFVLLTNQKERFTFDLKLKLTNHNIHTVYIPDQDIINYDNYLYNNLGNILNDDEVPLDVKCEIFYESVTDLSHKLFTKKIPDPQNFKELLNTIENTINFISSKDTINNISQIISKDYYTYTHGINVFIYSTYLLKHFGYNTRDIKHMGAGAFLHDIGKSQIPDEILNKPGRLNKKEWEIMKTHPELGIKMCESLDLETETLNIIYWHHEKKDGSGYPQGIRNLPQYSSIVTCCDIFDALTTSRVYASARTPFEALQLMQQKMNKELDILVLESFIKFIGGVYS